MFVVVIFIYFVACARNVSPSRIIGGGSIEEGRVSVAGTHGEQFIFTYQYREPSTFVFAFDW